MNLRILCLSEAMSPISHMDRVEGNVQMLSRQQIMTPAGKRFIPKLSGNALRKVMFRLPLAKHLEQACGLYGTLSTDQADLLRSGGKLQGSTARQDPAAWARARAALPMIKLLGCSLPDAILSGTLLSDFGWLVCRENRAFVAARVPAGVDVPANLRAAEEFVGGFQYFRHEIRHLDPEAAPMDRWTIQGTGAEAMNRIKAELGAMVEESKLQKTGNFTVKTKLMHGEAVRAAAAAHGATVAGADHSGAIFGGECVSPGALFVSDFRLHTANELEIGAALLALSMWQQTGGIVGGQSAKGHGRLRAGFTIESSQPIDVADLIARYEAHCVENTEIIRAWLDATFTPPKEKKKRKDKKDEAEVPAA